jgi:hypothetical protein
MAAKSTPKPTKSKKSDDPIKGLKNALKAAEVAKLAQEVSMLGGG